MTSPRCFLCKDVSIRMLTQNKTALLRECCFVWRRQLDLNVRMKLLQSSALPLGYGAVFECYNIITEHLKFVKTFLLFYRQNFYLMELYKICRKLLTNFFKNSILMITEPNAFDTLMRQKGGISWTHFTMTH